MSSSNTTRIARIFSVKKKRKKVQKRLSNSNSDHSYKLPLMLVRMPMLLPRSPLRSRLKLPLRSLLPS